MYFSGLCVHVSASVCVSLSKFVMMELTPPENSDLAIDLQAIYTPLLSEAIDGNARQPARGMSELKDCGLVLWWDASLLWSVTALGDSTNIHTCRDEQMLCRTSDNLTGRGIGFY